MKVVEEFREDGVIGICWWQYISVKEGVKIGVFNISFIVNEKFMVMIFMDVILLKM